MLSKNVIKFIFYFDEPYKKSWKCSSINAMVIWREKQMHVTSRSWPSPVRKPQIGAVPWDKQFPKWSQESIHGTRRSSARRIHTERKQTKKLSNYRITYKTIGGHSFIWKMEGNHCIWWIKVSCNLSPRINSFCMLIFETMLIFKDVEGSFYGCSPENDQPRISLISRIYASCGFLMFFFFADFAFLAYQDIIRVIKYASLYFSGITKAINYEKIYKIT